MTYEEEVARLIEEIHIAEAGDIRDIFRSRYPKRCKNHHSEYVQAQKACQGAVELKLIEKGANGRIYYKKKGLKGKHEDHSKALTKALTLIKCNFPDSRIFREHYIHDLNLRPDALILLTHQGAGFCLILEIANFERLDSLKSKRDIWNNSQSAKKYLSKLFNTKIPSFHFVVDGIGSDQGFLTLDQFISKIKED